MAGEGAVEACRQHEALLGGPLIQVALILRRRLSQPMAAISRGSSRRRGVISSILWRLGREHSFG
jgi:hypothetical protein